MLWKGTCNLRSMRKLRIALVIAAGVGLVSCNREPVRRDNAADRRSEPAAREVGREAYSATQEIKRGAKKAAKELKTAGKEFREGWSERRNETKQEDPPPRHK